MKTSRLIHYSRSVMGPQYNLRRHFWIVRHQLHTNSLEAPEVAQEPALVPVPNPIDKGQAQGPVRERVQKQVLVQAQE